MGKKKNTKVWAPKKDRIYIPGVGLVDAKDFQQGHVNNLIEYAKANNANVEACLASVLTLVDEVGQTSLLDSKDFKKAVDELDEEMGNELGNDEQ